MHFECRKKTPKSKKKAKMDRRIKKIDKNYKNKKLLLSVVMWMLLHKGRRTKIASKLRKASLTSAETRDI